MPALPDLKEGSRVLVRDVPAPWKPVSVSIPGCLRDAVPVKVDPQHAATSAAGVCKRVAPRLPDPNRRLLKLLGESTLRFCKKHLVPLDIETDISRETWLEEATYPAWRKEELRSVELDHDHPPADWIRSKSFIKDEFYPELKHARTINPRCDEFKVFSGPIFHAIEKEVFKLPFFIKKVPMADRPEFISVRLQRLGCKYYGSDYSSLEASIRGEIMRKVEMVVYKYMVQHVVGGLPWYRDIIRSLTGPQKLKFKNLTAWVLALRLSGDMCTSLGNGLTNVVLMHFACEQLGIPWFEGVFEGDDGLCVFADDRAPPNEFFTKLGFTIKMLEFSELNEASFCGMIFDTDSMVNITDPRDFLGTFGWASKQYLGARRTKLLGLAKCKALSYAHQYPGCPIISTFALRIIELTKHIDSRWVLESRSLSWWDRQKILQHSGEVPVKEISHGSRVLMEKVFGIAIEEQLEFEHLIQFMTFERPLESPSWIPDLWRRIYVDYTYPWTPGCAQEPILLARWCEQRKWDHKDPLLFYK